TASGLSPDKARVRARRLRAGRARDPMRELFLRRPLDGGRHERPKALDRDVEVVPREALEKVVPERRLALVVPLRLHQLEIAMRVLVKQQGVVDEDRARRPSGLARAVEGAGGMRVPSVPSEGNAAESEGPPS